MGKIAFILAAFFGLTGVIAGAMGAHALEDSLTPDQLHAFETAVRFQMYHALALIAVGLLWLRFPSQLLKWTIWLIISGTLLFSGSIYLLTLTSAKVGIVTPIGGLLLIIGWGLMLLWGIGVKIEL